MNLASQISNLNLVILFFLASPAFCASPAQDRPTVQDQFRTNSEPVQNRTPDRPTNLPPVPPVPVPGNTSPVDQFRDLLGMTSAERREYLSTRTEESRKQILAKVREYESMRPEQRELRLKATELRWYLLPLMRTPATNRPAQLQAIPVDNRELVETRLREWDQLSAATQKELLENEATLRYFSEMETSATNYPAAQRSRLNAGVARWQALPEERRREIARNFNQVFELNAREKEKVLQTVSDAERRQIEKTLQSFSHLPPQQRSQAIRSFEKLASLSPAERQQFLKNAERWKLMSPSERDQWRKLVANLSTQPPLPSLRSPALPPLPVAQQPLRSPVPGVPRIKGAPASPLATNQ